MKRSFAAAAIFFSLIIASCSKENNSLPAQEDPLPVPLAASTMLNLSYGADALQKMDVYLPAGRSTTATKVIIMIHGGGWSGGDKNDMTAFVDSLQRRMPGYAIINLNYRLAGFGTNTFPTQEADVKTAVDFINGKKSDFVISGKLVLLGVSAGSHLSLLQAYKNATPKITAVVDFFGPTDMADMYNNPASSQAPPAGIALLLNGTPSSNAALYASSSPINYVSAQSPPTIILHGGMDPLVRYQQSVTLRDKLVLNGISQQYIFYPAEGHGWVDPTLTDSFNKVQAFLNQYVL